MTDKVYVLLKHGEPVGVYSSYERAEKAAHDWDKELFPLTPLWRIVPLGGIDEHFPPTPTAA